MGAAVSETATAPDGVVHILDNGNTRCGLSASGWSRAITAAQIVGLVIFCEACNE